MVVLLDAVYISFVNYAFQSGAYKYLVNSPRGTWAQITRCFILKSRHLFLSVYHFKCTFAYLPDLPELFILCLFSNIQDKVGFAFET